MLTLKQKIDQVGIEIRLKENFINVLKKQLHELENSRVNCIHVWDNGVKGWEHEGRTCINCGINELYALTLLHMVEARKNII